MLCIKKLPGKCVDSRRNDNERKRRNFKRNSISYTDEY